MIIFSILFFLKLSFAQNNFIQINEILNTSLNCDSTNFGYKCTANNNFNQNFCKNYNKICPNAWDCLDLRNGFVCRRYDGTNFTLQHVYEPRRHKRTKTIDQCRRLLCQNGAICEKGKCKCLKHYMGKYCSEKINYCTENLCKHKTKCVSHVGGFTCECTRHLAGKYCQIPVQQAVFNMYRPNFIYEPLQYAGFKYNYAFHTEGLGVQPEVEINFGDGKIIKKRNAFVTLNSAYTTLIKYFPPPLNIMSDKLEVYFFTHIYKEPKIYNIKVRAWNKYQEIYNTDYEVRIITVGKCSLNVSLHNAAPYGKALNLFRQNPINIMSTSWSNCKHLKLQYQWEIHKVKHFKDKLSHKTFYTIKGSHVVELQNSNLMISPFSFDYGDYVILLNVKMIKPKLGIKRKLVTWITVNERPIIAHIQGGFQRFVYIKSMFYLDASMSYDPNYGKNKQPPMTFKWMCQPPGQFCKGFRALNSSGPILIVPPSSLPKQQHKFTVYVNNYKSKEVMTNYTGIAKQAIQLIDKILPLFMIRCLRNCLGGHANNLYPIALKGINIVRINKKHMTYTNWLVYPHPETNQQTVMDLDNTEYSDANSLIILYGEQLESGDDYKFLYTGYVQENTLNLQTKKVTFADFYLTTYNSPSDGSCSVYPTEGYAMLNTFTIKCDGFANLQSPIILYEVVQFIDLENRESSGAFVAYDYSGILNNITLSPGFRKNDYVTTLHITATDHNGVYEFVEISVIVFPLIYLLEDPNDVLQRFIHVGTGLNSPLNVLLSNGNYFELLQQIRSTCFTLEHFIQSEDALYIDTTYIYSTVEQARDILISYLYQVPISTLQTIKHVATALDKVMNLPSKTDIWRASTVIGIKTMKNLIQKLEDTFNIHNEEVFQNDMDDIGILLISIASSILKTPTVDAQVLKEGIMDSENNRLIRRKFTQQINPFRINKETLLYHDSNDAMDVIDRFMKLYMTYKSPNERTTLFTNSKMSLIMKKADPEHLTLRKLSVANAVAMEPIFDKSLYNKHAIYNFEMIIMNNNPNWYNDNDIEAVPFPFVKMNLRNEADGSPVDADMMVYMRPIGNQPLQVFNASLPIMLFWQIKEKHIRVHRIIVPKGGKLIIQFLPIQDNHKLRVVVKKETRPRMIDFWLNGINIPQHVPKRARDKGLSVFVDDEATEHNTFYYLGVLPHIDTLKELMKDVEEPILPHVFHYEDDLDVDEYDENLEQYHEATTKVFYDGINFIKHLKTIPKKIYNNRTLPYGFSAHSVRCVMWNEASKLWKSSCNVRASTTSTRVVCNCTGHDPVTVSYQKVSVRYQEYTQFKFFLPYVDNPLIPFVVLFSLILFIGLFKWAAEQDDKDRLKRTVCFLVDNYPQCEYCYLIIVHTGRKIKSGTTSKVTIELEGTYATSLPHVLKDWRQDVMLRGNQDWFVLKTMKPLGEIFCLHVWTDYSGSKPSWYCNKIIVHDVQEQQVWFFLVNKWFDPINGDGTMSYTIYQSRHENIFAVSYQLQENLAREFESGMHGWLSILSKHPYSNYTRKQRVGVAYLHMVLIMMLLVLLNELPVADSPLHQLYKTGSYQLEVRDMVVATYAVLLAFPIQCILMWWFRCIRPSSQWTDSRLDRNFSRFNFDIATSEEVLWIDPNDKHTNIAIQQRPKPTQKHVSFYADFYEPEGDRALRSRWSLEKLEKKAGDETVVPLRAPTSKVETESSYDVHTEPPDNISAIYGQEVIAHSYCCPPYCVFVGWVLVFIISVVSVYITTVYGISYGWFMSLHYLTSFFLAIVFSILVMEPLKLLLSAVCLFFCNRREYSVEDRSDMITALNSEYQVPDFLKNQVIDKINTLRQSPTYMPLVEEAVHKAKRNRVSSFLMRIIIADLLLLTLFVLVFLTMIYNVVDPSAYLHLQNIIRLLKSPGMTDVYTQADLIDYLNTTIIANLQYFDNATQKVVTDPLNPTIDEVNYLLGVISLRQVRKAPTECNPGAYKWAARCTMDFDTQNYTEGWKKLIDNNDSFATMRRPWRFQKPIRIFRGFFMHYNESKYPPGSYQAYLGKTKRQSFMVLDYLVRNDWFDFLTTVIYIDFVLYNLNNQQLTIATLMAERTEQGVYSINKDIEVVKMQALEAITQLYLLFFLLVVFIWLVWYIHKESRKYSLLRPKQMFSNKWNSIKKFLLILGIINVIIYIKKILEFDYYSEKISHAGSEIYPDFESVAFWDNVLLLLIALMQFLVIIEVCDLFSTCYRVNLSLTIVYKSRVTSFFIYLIFMIITFTWSGYVLFGRLSYDFQNFKVAFFAVLTFNNRAFNVKQFGNWDSFFLTFVYYSAAVVIFFFVFRWIIATMMIHAFSAAKRSAHFDPYLPILSNYTKKYFDSIDSSPNRKPLKLTLYLNKIEPRMHALGHLFVYYYHKKKGRDLMEQRQMAMDAIAFSVIRKKKEQEKETHDVGTTKEQARALARSIIIINILKNKLDYLSAKIDIRIREERYKKMLKLVRRSNM